MRATAIIHTALLAAFAFSVWAAEPKEGFVPNESTAIAIAIAVWAPIYGAEAVSRQKPYVATLTKEIWVVEGSLPKGMLGGVARAEIARKDGRVLTGC